MALPQITMGDAVPVHGHPGTVVGIVHDPRGDFLVTVRLSPDEGTAATVSKRPPAPITERASGGLYCKCNVPGCPAPHPVRA